MVRIEERPALNRARGAFIAQGSRENESKEPERTERLLANPLALIPAVGQDAYESIAVTVLFKCRGDLKHAMAYRLARLSAQMLLVCIAGIGVSLVPGAGAALALVSTTVTVQLLVFLWILCLCPSVDRIDNAVQAAGWGVECCSMLLLLLASLYPALVATARVYAAAYSLSLLGVGLPLLKLVYEALLAPCGSYAFMCIDGKARKNPCDRRARLWLFRLLLSVATRFAGCCCSCYL